MPDNNENPGDTLTRPLLDKARTLGFTSRELQRLQNLYLLHPEKGEIRGSHPLPSPPAPDRRNT